MGETLRAPINISEDVHVCDKIFPNVQELLMFLSIMKVKSESLSHLA